MKKLFIGIGVFIVAVIALAGGGTSNKSVQEPLSSTPAATKSEVQAPAEESTAQAQPTTQTPSATTQTPSSSTSSSSNTYTNVDGNTVQSPTYSSDGSVPEGATAQCEDGTYSFSQHRSGTCSHHGGVSRWL